MDEGLPQAVRQMPGDLCTAPRIISLTPLSLATNVTDLTLGASDLWLETRTGGGGIPTLALSFFGRSPWLYGQQEFISWSVFDITYALFREEYYMLC